MDMSNHFSLFFSSSSSFPFLVVPLPFHLLADRDHCNKTVDLYEDVSSPAVTSANWGKPLSCWYRFRSFRGTPRDWILRVRFKKFKVGVLENATTCSGGYLQVCLFYYTTLSALSYDLTNIVSEIVHKLVKLYKLLESIFLYHSNKVALTSRMKFYDQML